MAVYITICLIVRVIMLCLLRIINVTTNAKNTMTRLTISHGRLRIAYKKRQCINEHVFGIIKRQWGFDHTFMKGLTRVDAETGFIFTAYNFRRIINIIGIHKFIRKMRKNRAFLFPTRLNTLGLCCKKYFTLPFFRAAKPWQRVLQATPFIFTFEISLAVFAQTDVHCNRQNTNN
ncbi:MAG TPA: transposase [Bacteroidia bacterium]